MARLGAISANGGTADGSSDAGQETPAGSEGFSFQIPGTEAGDSAASYWADRVNESDFSENPLGTIGASAGLVGASLWTSDTATDTALTLGTAGGLAAAQRAGVLWFRAYPNAGGEGMGINWGGKNMIRFDWHRFNLNGKSVFRPHIDSKPLGLKHWPWQ